MSEILSIEDLLNIKLIPNIGKIRNSLSPQLRQIYDKGYSADLSELADCYNALPNSIAPEPRALILCFYLLKILELPELPENWHIAILYFIKTLKEGKFIEIEHIFSRLTTKSLYTATEKIVEFNQILSEFKLMKTISDDFKYDTTAEIGFLTSIVKGKILDSATSYESILKSLNYLKKALEYGMFLETTKDLLARMILEWAKDNKNTGECRRVIKEMKDLNSNSNSKFEFEREIMGEIEEQGSAAQANPGPSLGPVSGQASDGIIRINPKYISPAGQAVQIFVYECSKQGVNGRIALKECKSANKASLDQYVEEAKYLERVSEKTINFLKFYNKSMKEINENGTKYFVFTMEMEYVEENLASDRQKRILSGTPYSENEFVCIFAQLVQSFNYLTIQGINHRDIKPSNILITPERIIKIIDFNAACEYHDQTHFSTTIGTKDFMSPEMRKGLENPSMKVITKQDKSDVFSLGMTLLYLLTTENLCDLNLESKKNDLKAVINKVQISWAKEILNKMLDFNMNTRCGLKDILQDSSNTGTIIN